MLARTVLAALTALLSTAAASDVSEGKDFTGVGQLRTVYIGSGHDDLGCLTSDGKWTVDESKCGTFVTAQITDNTFYLFSTKGGACGIDVATFKCGGDVKWAAFGNWGTQATIPGKSTLRYSQYGVMATDAPDSPPSLTDEPLAIHFYSGSEKGKWVWLSWKLLDHVDDAE